MSFESSRELSQDDFERAAAEALDSLPAHLSKLVENVIIVVENEPTSEDLESLDGDRMHTELLGIYRGVARTKRGVAAPFLPDRIALFRGPINRISHTREEALARVRDTVVHEIGHYFGLADEEMPH